jgi:lipoprotein-releasing system permease protein
LITNLHWEIATKYLKSKRKESFISFISIFARVGIMLGVAILIIVMSVMNGFKKEIITGIIGISGHVSVSDQFKMVNYQENINKIKSNKAIASNISSIAPTIEAQVLATYNNYSLGAMVYGLTQEDLKNREAIAKSLGSYALAQFSQKSDAILVGKTLARNLNLKVGDSLSIMTPNGYSTALGTMPKFGNFVVVGLLDTGMYQYDSSMIVMNFVPAQKFFNYVDSAQKIDIFLKDSSEAKNIKLLINTQFRDELYVDSWEDTNAYLMNALDVERNVMFLILSLVILIATFNIVSGLIMLVRSKTKEIAILKTIGLSNRSIVIIFLLIGIRIGAVGTFLGCLLGTLFSYNIENIRKFLEYFLNVNLFSQEIYFLSKLPVDINLKEVAVIVFLSLFFAIISAVYPAIRASKIIPTEGLKYD